MSTSIFVSTAFSDVVLCTTALMGATAVVESDGRFTRRLASAGFLLVALAAAIGIVRYGFLPDIEALHRLASSAGGMIGLPVIAIAMLLEARNVEKTLPAWLAVLALVALWSLLNASPVWRIVSGIGAQVLWLVVAWCWLRQKPMRMRAGFALVSVVITVFAAMGVGIHGEWQGIPRVDLLHYLLALALVAQIIAIGFEHRQSRAWAYTA